MKSKFEKDLRDKAYGFVPDKWNEIKKEAKSTDLKTAPRKNGFPVKPVIAAAASLVLVIGAVVAVNAGRKNRMEKQTATQSAETSEETVPESARFDEDTSSFSVFYTDDQTAISPETETGSIQSTAKQNKDGSSPTQENGPAVTVTGSQTVGENKAVKPETSKKEDTDSLDKTDTHNATVPATTVAGATAAETMRIPDWESRSTPGKFRYFTYNGKEYSYTGGWREDRSVKRSGKLIEKKRITCIDEATDKPHSTDIYIYSLSNMSDDLALGVAFGEGEKLRPYVNVEYVPKTLGGFLNAIDYKNTLSYGGITTRYKTSEPVRAPIMAADVNKYLFANTSAPNIASTEFNCARAVLTVNCEELNLVNKALYVYENGYIATNLVGYLYMFNIGEDNVDAFRKNVFDFSKYYNEQKAAAESLGRVTGLAGNTTSAPETSAPYIPVTEVSTKKKQ